ncbi:MAG: glycosyltransferase family 39 protein [Candidatus Brocadiae bacterium]|nr:glycosyltransferase family 39 protein [Candidatus Brocadiia bacterium]
MPGSVGVDPLTAARWLNAALFGGSVFLLALWVHRCTKSPWLATLGCVLALASPVMLAPAAATLSEPLYLVLVLTGMILLDAHVQEPRMWRLLGSAACVGLAFLTRWTGAPFVMTAAVALILLPRASRRRRLLWCVVFGAVSCGPIALWLVRNVLVGGSAANRTLVLHPITMYQIRNVFWAARSWVLPGKLADWVRMRYFIGGLACLCGLAAWLTWRHVRAGGQGSGRSSPWRPPFVLLIAIPCYALFLAVSISLFDVSVPVNDRLLLPVYACSLVLVLWLVNVIVMSIPRPAHRKAALVIVSLVVLALRLPTGAAWALQRSRNGDGYTAAMWRESPTVRRVAGIAENVAIYTNDPCPLYVQLKRHSYRIPTKARATSDLPNPRYSEQLKSLAEDIHREDGRLVYFTVGQRAFVGQPSQDELVEALRLEAVAELADGAVYRPVPNTEEARVPLLPDT